MAQYTDTDGVSDVGRAFVVSAPDVQVSNTNGTKSSLARVEDVQQVVDSRLTEAQREAIDALTSGSTAAQIVAALQAV